MMKESNVDRLLLALLNAGDVGETAQGLCESLEFNNQQFRAALHSARRMAGELRAVVPRPIYPDYVYRLVDRDNPNVPAFRKGAEVDMTDTVTRLRRIHNDAATMSAFLDGRTRDGKLALIIERHVGRALEDIAGAQEELLPA